MGKVPIRLREVVYALSPYQQSVMTGLWKDLPHKAAHHAANVRRQWGMPATQNGSSSWGGGGGAPPPALTWMCVPPGCLLQLRDAVIFCVAPIVGIAYYCADYVSCVIKMLQLVACGGAPA